MILTELIWPWPLTLGYFPKMGKTAKLMPSTTSLDPPGAELGNLIGGDEPEYDVLEQPEQDLAMDRWEG